MPLNIDPRILKLLSQFPGIQQTSGQGGGPPVGGPMAPAQQPQLQQPGPMPDNRSWIDKLKDGAQGALSNYLPAPAGMGGLLSDDEVGAARKRGLSDFGLSMLANAHGQSGGNAPSFGQALQSSVGAGRQGYEGNIDSMLKGKLTGMQLGQQAQILRGRQSIGQYLMKSMDADQPTQMKALRSAYMMAAALGDHETMKTLSPLLEKDPGLDKPTFSHVDQGDKVVIVDPRDPTKVLATYPKSKVPMSDEARASMEMSLGLRRESLDARMEQQAAGRESRMVTQYDQNTKRMQAQAIALQSLNEMRTGAFQGDPVSQQTALQDYIRLVLPGQIVSQGELHKYANQLGLGQKGEQLLAGLDNGRPLHPSVIKSIYDHADKLAVAAHSAGNYYRKQFQQRGAKYQIDPEAFIDHFGFLDQTEEKKAPVGAHIVDRYLKREY